MSTCLNTCLPQYTTTLDDGCCYVAKKCRYLTMACSFVAIKWSYLAMTCSYVEEEEEDRKMMKKMTQYIERRLFPLN